MKFGMPSLVELSSAEETIVLCRELGLSFVEWNLNFSEFGLDVLKSPSFLRLLEESKIASTVHLDESMDIACPNRYVSDAWFQTVHESIVAAKKMSASLLNMHMNEGVHMTLPNGKVYMYERDSARYLSKMREFRDRCDEWIGDYPLFISVENTDGWRSYEKEAIEILLASPHFSLTWDVGHSHVLSESDAPFLLSHREKIRHFHIHDGILSSRKDHLALGDGDLPLADRLTLAEKLCATCVLETKTVEALKKSVGWLNEKHFKGKEESL